MKKDNTNWRAGRIAVIGTASMVITFILIVFAIYQTGVIRGINTVADTNREAIIKKNCLDAHIEGTFYDRNDVALTSSKSAGEVATLLFPDEFSYIIGSRNSLGSLSGLRARFAHELFDMDNSHKDGVGADIKLTIDLGLQQLASNLLYGHAGSINIIDADTGEILCMASRGDPKITYDVNILSSKAATYNKIKGFYLNKSTDESHTAGSVFKILTTILMLENDTEEIYVVENPFKTSSGKPIKNSTTAIDGQEADLQKALYYSCNTYFATRGLLIGAANFQEIARRFHIGEDIELDFVNLNNSNFDVYGADPEFELASTAYGQGKTVISPIHLTAIMGGIMNEGRDMLKPYLISSIVNEGKTVTKGKSEILSKNVVSASVVKKLKKLLNNTALNAYEFNKAGKKDYGYVIAKTGTAQTAVEGSNHVYLLVGYSYGDRNYAICIDWVNVPSSVYGQNLVPTAESIINYINRTTS